MTTIVTDMNNEKVEENNNEKKIKALENTINGYTNLIFNNNNNNNSSTIDDLENIIESSLVRADELKALLNTVKNDSETANKYIRTPTIKLYTTFLIIIISSYSTTFRFF